MCSNGEEKMLGRVTSSDIMVGEAEQGHQQFLAQGPSDEYAEVLFPALSKL